MIQVKYDVEGADLDKEAAEAAVGKVLNYYKQALAGLTCPLHGREPWLKVHGRTLETLAVSIETCCQELLNRTDARTGGVSRRNQE